MFWSRNKKIKFDYSFKSGGLILHLGQGVQIYRDSQNSEFQINLIYCLIIQAGIYCVSLYSIS